MINQLLHICPVSQKMAHFVIKQQCSHFILLFYISIRDYEENNIL